MTRPTPRGEYPDVWHLIATAVKKAANYECERCGVPHGVGHYLTVHHLDGNKSNCHPANLAALCQGCHLILQAKFDPSQPVLQEALPGLVGEEDWIRNRRELYQRCRHEML